MISKAKARLLRQTIEKAAVSLPDKDASMSAELFPRLKGDGSLVAGGTRINWHGTIKRAAADLWDTEQNDPDHAVNLWEDIEYRDGIRIIPEHISAVNPFGMDELGWWGDVLYRSKLAANVYTPVEYPQGWEEVT